LGLFCGILTIVSTIKSVSFESLYAQFDSPITVLDCGKKCSPHNNYGVPFCCDTNHAVPAAYQSEWKYLSENTNLWHRWDSGNPNEANRLRTETPDNQVLIECLGHLECQRNYRSINCRAFPFFPYISKAGEYIGISYYWIYEDRCWVISNLDMITAEYRSEFIAAFDNFFFHDPRELSNFHYHSKIMRQVFGRRKRSIPILHRNGSTYKITPSNGRLRRVDSNSLSKFGLYKIAAKMPFPDEK